MHNEQKWITVESRYIKLGYFDALFISNRYQSTGSRQWLSTVYCKQNLCCWDVLNCSEKMNRTNGEKVKGSWLTPVCLEGGVYVCSDIIRTLNITESKNKVHVKSSKHKYWIYRITTNWPFLPSVFPSCFSQSSKAWCWKCHVLNKHVTVYSLRKDTAFKFQ